MKKFELTEDFIDVSGRKLFRIKALISFRNVKKGDFGGYIGKEENLSHYGYAWVSGNADYSTVNGFENIYRNTTFFKQKDDSIGVVCGCFYGTVDEFRAKVKETHGDSELLKEYLEIADLMELHFNKEEED